MAKSLNALAMSFTPVDRAARDRQPLAVCKLDRLRELRATIDALRTDESQDPLLAWIVQREGELPENLSS